MVDPELLDACRRGDAAALEEVVRRTYRQVYSQALRLVGDRQDAEDVAQEAFVRAFRGLSTFRGEAQFETWMYRIVANAAMSHLRRRRRFGELLIEAATIEVLRQRVVVGQVLQLVLEALALRDVTDDARDDDAVVGVEHREHDVDGKLRAVLALAPQLEAHAEGDL